METENTNQSNKFSNPSNHVKKDLNGNKSKSNIIAFHIRNDDVSSQQDYDGTPTFDYIVNLIPIKSFKVLFSD